MISLRIKNMDYKCRIYLHSNLTMEELTDSVANLYQGEGTGLGIIVTAWAEIYIFENSDYKRGRTYEFPDGFLYFKYIIFIDPLPVKIDFQDFLIKTINVLYFFWNQNYPAVAACDFEDELPNKGGYKSLDVPWPGSIS